MRKTKSLVALLLTALLLLSSLPLTLFSAAAVTPAEAFTVANDGTDATGISTSDSNGSQTASASGIATVSPDGSCYFSQIYGGNDYWWSRWASFKVPLDPDAFQNTQALAFWIDVSELSVKTQYAIHLLNSADKKITIDGTDSTSFFAPGQTAYLIPSDTGVAEQISLGGDAAQPLVELQIGFAGYVVIPITGTPAPVDISKIALNRVTNGSSEAPDEWMIQPEDGGKKMYFDNFGSVNDLDFFLQNIYQFGPMTGGTEAQPTYRDGTLSWQSVEGAVSYRAAVYDENYAFVKSVDATETTAEIGALGAGCVQVQALNADGAVIASTKLLKMLGTPLFTILNNGSDASKFTAVNDVQVAHTDGTGVSPDSSYYTQTFYTSLNWNDWGRTAFDISTDQLEFAPKAISMFVDYSAISQYNRYNFFFYPAGSDNDTLKNDGGSLSTIRAAEGSASYYLISTVDGSVTTKSFEWGYDIPAGFVGYLVFPVITTAEADYSSLMMTMRRQYNGPGQIAEADGGKSFHLDNVAAVADIDLYLDTMASAFGTMRPTQGFEAPTLSGTTVSWDAVDGAASYDVNIYDAGYNYVSTHVADTNSAVISGLPEIAILQIVARNASGQILKNSGISRVSTVKDYDVLNAADDAETLTATFNEAQVGNAKTPTGKGLSMLTTNENNAGASMTYTFPETDLAQYEAVAYYVDLDLSDPAATGWTGSTVVDNLGNVLSNLKNPLETDPIETNPSTGDPLALNIYYVSARDGSVSRLISGWEGNNALIPKDAAGWIVIMLDKSKMGDSHPVSSLTFNYHGWHASSVEANKNQPMYVGELLGIRSYTDFVANLDLRSMGYLGATDGTGTLSAELEAGSDLTYTWDAVAGVAQYRVNLYDLTSGKAVYTDHVMTTDTHYTINAADLGKVGIQVLALDAEGATIQISNPGAFEPITDSMLPSVAGASFNAKKVVRFQNIAPSTLATSVKVVTYGTALIPTQLLEGELTLATPDIANASANAAIEASSTYYSFVSNSEDKMGVRISARAYAILKDGYGNRYTVYSAETLSRSVNGMARDMATAVLTYPEAKALVTTWTEKVTESTTADQVSKVNPADITGPELAEFLLANPQAVAKAAELKSAQ